MQRFLSGLTLVWVCLGIVAAPVLFGAVSACSATPIHALAIVMAVTVSVSLMKGNPAARWSWVDGGVALFGIVAFAGYFRSPNEFQSRQEMLQVFACGSFYMAVRTQLHRTRHMEAVFAILFVTVTLISCYAILQHFSEAKMVLWKETKYWGRSSGTYVCPNHYGGLVAMLAPLVFSFFIWGRMNPAYRIALGYGLIVMVIGLFFSYSRGSMLSLGAAFAGVLLLGMRKKIMAILIVVAAGFGLFGIVFYTLQEIDPEQWLRFWNALQHGEASRPQMWKSAWQIFVDHPILGVGPMMFDAWHGHYRGSLMARAVHVHNDYLHLLADYGLAGGIVMLLLMGALMRRLWLGFLKFGLVRSVRYATDAVLSPRAAFQKAFFIGGSGAWIAVLSHLVVDFDMHILANALILTVLLAFLVSLSFSSEEWGRGHRPFPPALRWGMAAGLLVLAGIFSPLVVRNCAGDSWRLKAVQAEKNLEWAEADLNFRRAVEIDPQNSLAWDEYAQFLYKRTQLNVMQRPKWASRFLEVCQEALRTNPLNFIARLRRGEIYDLLGRVEEAEKEYQAALEFDPNNPYYHSRLGLHYQRRGMADRAGECFSRAVKLGGDRVARENLKELKPL